MTPALGVRYALGVSAATPLLSMTREELSSFLTSRGEPRYRADQVFRWLHTRGARSFDAMTDLPQALRGALQSEGLEPGGLTVREVLVARDTARKILFTTRSGREIESVVIPMRDRWTLCVSSQVGCKLGCRFCLTARMPVRQNLAAAEIVDQVYQARAHVPGGAAIHNIVFMGMGEPLDNFDEVVRACRILTDPCGAGMSPRRITVSTVGMAPRIPELGHATGVNLAVSLNAANDAKRDKIMPVNRRYPLAVLFEAVRRYPLPPRRRITFEYVMLDGFNDGPEDARELVALLRGIRCKVNLIPWNPFPGAEFGRPPPERVAAFQAILVDGGFTAPVRESKGRDIGAACGQLDGTTEGARPGSDSGAGASTEPGAERPEDPGFDTAMRRR